MLPRLSRGKGSLRISESADLASRSPDDSARRPRPCHAPAGERRLQRTDGPTVGLAGRPNAATSERTDARSMRTVPMACRPAQFPSYRRPGPYTELWRPIRSRPPQRGLSGPNRGRARGPESVELACREDPPNTSAASRVLSPGDEIGDTPPSPRGRVRVPWSGSPT